MKKAITLCSTVLLALSSFPITSFADELNQPDAGTATEETSTAPEEIEDSQTSESDVTAETPSVEPTPEQPTSPEPVVPPTLEEVVEPEITEEIPPETIPEAIENDVAEPVQPEPEAVVQTQNEAVIPVDYSSIHFEKVSTTEEFVEMIGESAREVAKENDLFASVMIAQAILESGSGGSQLSRAPYYNLFGIKGEFEGQSVTFATSEDDGSGNMYQIDAAFRAYPSYKESFEDYAELLTDGLSWNVAFYQGTWKSVAGEYQNATQALTGTYATDSSYNLKLNGLIETYELTEYDREKSESSPGTAATHEDSDFTAYSGVNQGAYADGNCTQYAHSRMVEVSGKAFSTSLGNAKDWSGNAAAQGYSVSHTAESGTVVVFQPGVALSDAEYGHVAFTGAKRS